MKRQNLHILHTIIIAREQRAETGQYHCVVSCLGCNRKQDWYETKKLAQIQNIGRIDEKRRSHLNMRNIRRQDSIEKLKTE